jgi:PKD repeat protein
VRGTTNYYRYSAIEEVRFEAGGKVLYQKAADGCNDPRLNGHYTEIVDKANAIPLGYGQTFDIYVSAQNYTRYTTSELGVYIDLNRDGDFTDDGEFLGQQTVPAVIHNQLNGTPPTAKKLTFTLPCGVTGSGKSQILLRSTAPYNTTWTKWTKSNPCATGFGISSYGETEAYWVDLSNPTSVSAGFFSVDTAFVKVPVSFTNANQAGYIRHAWDAGNDGTVEGTGTDFSYKFNTTGSQCVELYSENCFGADSVVKCVQIVNPQAPPVADFVASASKVELFNAFTLTDLSNNGAHHWDWFMYQEDDSAGTRIDGDSYPDMRGNDETINKNPEIFSAKGIPGFPGVGKWCIGLTASNDIGSSVTVIKKNYVEITKGCDVEMGPGTITSIPGNVITCTAGTLVSKKDGSGNYSTNESGLDALVAPCGATSITFEFDLWQMKAGVNLKVYDGQDASGTPLHPANGFTNTLAPSGPLVANSGAMYFLWSSGTQSDKGFLGHWTSTIGTQSPPVADFTAADTMYKLVFNQFTNTSQNATGEVFYTWEIDGGAEGNSKNLDKAFFSEKTYNVCLTVETCAGKDTKCKNVVVAPITSPAELDFYANERRPKAGDPVEFTAMSDKANAFKWTFFPGTSVTFESGTNDNSQNPVVSFSQPGKYTVSLKGWNSLTPTDSATSYVQVIKDQYVIVIDYCTPNIGITTSEDIAINRVLLEDNAPTRRVLIDNQTMEDEYTDNTEDLDPAVLTFGGTYNLTLSRNTNANAMNRKVWVDWNIDGDFNDAGELVLTETSAMTKDFMGSFVVPDLDESFEGVTRMRIGVSYKNDPNDPCGANSGVANANRIGEFEDYALRLENDNTNPYIVMNDADTVYVEVGSTYTDAGAKAYDPTEGDITFRLKTNTADVNPNAAGIYYVTYCVKDASGNEPEEGCAVRTVYVVVDQTAPTLTLNGSDPEYVDVITGKFTDPGATAQDNTDGDLTTAIQVTGSVNTFQIGTYTLTYTVQDAQRNETVVTRDVIVRDRVHPTITNDEVKVINGRNVVEVQLQSVFVDRTVLADNYNNGTFGPMFNFTISPSTAQGDADVDTRVKGTTVVTYKVWDESGNETTMVIDYVVEDYIKPVISLNTLDTVFHTVNHPYTPVQASVTDNLYDNTQVSLVRESNVNPFKLGLYTDKYTAIDASGNEAVRNRWVRVIDDENPVISSKVGPIVKLGLFSNVKLSDYLKLSDNYDGPDILLGNLDVTFNDVNFYEEGIYAAVFETQDNSGNMSAPYTLLVEVSRSYERITGIETVDGVDLMKVYPNPSNGLFSVSFDLPSNEDVTVAVYDMMGNKVADVVEGQLQKGDYTVDMTGKAAGMYFVRMTAHNKVFNQKIIIE